MSKAEIYASNALFRAMWIKELRAAAAEAIETESSDKAAPPSLETIERLLDVSAFGPAKEKPLAASVTETRARKPTDAVCRNEAARRLVGPAQLYREASTVAGRICLNRDLIQAQNARVRVHLMPAARSENGNLRTGVRCPRCDQPSNSIKR